MFADPSDFLMRRNGFFYPVNPEKYPITLDPALNVSTVPTPFHNSALTSVIGSSGSLRSIVSGQLQPNSALYV